MAVDKDSRRKTCLVSRDINMRVICDSIGLAAEDYTTERVVHSSDELYSGLATHLVDDQVIDRFYDDEDVYIEEDEIEEKLYPNEYVLMVSNANDKKTCIGRFDSHFQPIKKILHSKIPDWKISARNKEQAFAIDLLMDPSVKVVSLVGRAGSGKTLCAIAAGLQQNNRIKGEPIRPPYCLKTCAASWEGYRILTRNNGREDDAVAYANSR